MVLEELIIGVPKEYFLKDMDERVEKIIRMVIKRYEEAGVKIQEISLPHTEYALSCYYIIAPSEASANLARYDGIKYGYSEDDSGNDLLAVYFNSRGKGFGSEVKRRIMLGTYSLSSGYYDAYYLRAQKVRTLIKEDFQKAFQQVDAIITPVTPTPAFKLGEKITDPLTMYLSDIFTVAVNLAGLPALSLPAGQIKDEISGLELPLGFQIIGKPFSEDEILEIGSLFNNGLI
jgi:aspartyl-tRNA(Asn)/glutamyl-tRNA(Gln) amidotransferase subunit A